MGRLIVVSQALTVIGRRDHDRLVQQAERGKPVEDASELRVREGDLTVVGTAFEPLPEGRGRDVWRVGVVEMHPSEKRRLAVTVREPGHRVLRDLVAPALRALAEELSRVRLAV